MPLVSPEAFTEKELKTKDFLSLLSHDDNIKYRLHTTKYKETNIEYFLDCLCNGNIIFPAFNQKKTWSKSHMDSFIEAVLLEMPIPALTLISDKHNELSVVIDGYQRLITLLLFSKYLPIKYETENNQELYGFCLDTIPVKSRWYGMSYDNLSNLDKNIFSKHIISYNTICLDDSESFDYAYYMYRKLSSSSYFDDKDSSNLLVP